LGSLLIRFMPTTLITGGSSGIGLALSRALAARGHRLLWVALEAAELEAARADLQVAFPQLEVHTYACDLSAAGAAQEVHLWTRDLGFPVDLLINNAGFGSSGFIDETDPEHELAMLRLHVQTLYSLTRYFLRDMLIRGAGRIINLASISAYAPTPGLATYAASKAFVMQFSLAIDYELRRRQSPVRVLTVCPTPVRTGFARRASMEDSPLFNSWMRVSPETVARDTLRALDRGRSVVIPHRGLQLLHRFVSRLPQRWLIWFAAREMGF